jgi:hypothetical protein
MQARLTKKIYCDIIIYRISFCMGSFKMKKAILLAAVLFITLSAKGFTDEPAFFEIHGLLQRGLSKNYDSILQKASSLTAFEKMILLDIHEKNSGVPFVVNLTAGFGIGSYIQGDVVNGTIQLSGQLLGLAGMIASGFMYDADFSSEQSVLGSAFFATGEILFLGTRLYGCITPFLYKNSYNKKLKNALQYYNVSYDIIPEITDTGSGKITLAVSLAL